MTTVTETPQEKYKFYIDGLVAREQHRRQRLQQRAEEAMQVARRAADFLRAYYGVTRVWVFGSVLEPNYFHERSDIDLAVEGLPPEVYLQAWSLLNGGASEINSAFEIDLVTPEECRPAIWASVEREGQPV
ncbi:MAG: nucleotidyltransferase domain-containing protein [Anaerolineae bacterium]|nr:nucleotidyltransferase domain-containing protein [Anaerolineae bacterium]